MSPERLQWKPELLPQNLASKPCPGKTVLLLDILAIRQRSIRCQLCLVLGKKKRQDSTSLPVHGQAVN